MKLTVQNSEHLSYAVCDAAGQPLPFVMSYDTVTKEVEMLLKLKDNEIIPDSDEAQVFVAFKKVGKDLKPVVVKFVLEGSYALDSQGNRIE